MKPPGLGLLFGGRFFITVLISMLWLFWSYFLFLPGSVLEDFTFLRICLFLPDCPFYWHRVTHSTLSWSFVFLCCLLYVSFFISNFIDLSLFLFLMSLSTLFIFSKNQLLVLFVFVIASFLSFSFISNLIFTISFILLILVGFFCSFFLVALVVSLGCLFDVCCFNVGLHCYKIPS